MQSNDIDTIIFDLGGVLVDWNPEYLYRKIFAKEEEMKRFLSEVCTPHWNEQQDAGRPLETATNLLLDQHPQYEKEIRAFYDRWEEMLGGPMEATVSILERIHSQNRHRLYALTNWSHETFPIAQQRYSFLGLFEGILVSGAEKLKKPDPAIYRLLFDRYRINPETAIFIDDSRPNVKAARASGLKAIHFQGAERLARELTEMGLL